MTEGNTAHVHHMLVYLCSSLNASHSGGVCSDVISSINCSNATLLAGWAIGGEVTKINGVIGLLVFVITYL